MADSAPHAEIDAGWMRRAVALAWRARPASNPRVGSVIVRGGELAGEGFHVTAGRDHAEVVALKQAGERAAGSTMYVTLEPHDHHHRTPPCTEAIIAARVARVVIGAPDPNPLVSGRGIERLKAAGVEVVVGVEAPACRELIRGWCTHVTAQRPHVTLKVAMTLDGRIATRTGESQWITGPDARRDGHRLRARAYAVMVGVGTVLADDPLLTPRDAPGELPPPPRVVLDTTLRTPLESALVRTAREVPTWVLHGSGADPARVEALRDRGVETLAVATDDHTGRVDLDAALRALDTRGVLEVLVEGGSAVHGALLDARAADALVCYIAPRIIGGRDAAPAFGGQGVAELANAHALRDVRVAQLGPDLVVTAEFADVHRDHHAGR